MSKYIVFVTTHDANGFEMPVIDETFIVDSEGKAKAICDKFDEASKRFYDSLEESYTPSYYTLMTYQELKKPKLDRLWCFRENGFISKEDYKFIMDTVNEEIFL